MNTNWEDCYQTGQTPWDKGAAAPPLVDWLAQPGCPLAGEVLVLGCGLGHDVRALAGHPGTRVCGLDLSATALAQARRFPAVNGESYVQGDLFSLPSALRGRFDWVVEHTCFCAIDPARRVDYVQAAGQLLRPGGHLFAIFYLRPWAQGEARPPGDGPPFGVEPEELDRLFADGFTLLEEETPTRAFPGREGRERRRLLRRE